MFLRTMLSLRHIEVFHAVYVAGSISGAARALHVSQPAVSKVLRHAESRVGFALFDLVRGRLVPTEEAHALFAEARDLTARVDSLNETTRNLKGGGGHLRLAVLPSLGLDLAPGAVARLAARHPRATFEIQTLHNAEMQRALIERTCDIAVSYDPPRHPRLVEIPLGRAELVVLFDRTALSDPPERVTLEMFGDAALIQLSDTGSIGNLVNERLDHRITRPVRIAVQTYYVAAALVRQGAGIAIVDEFTARASAGGAIDWRPLADPVPFTIHGVHLEDRPPSRLARELLDALRQSIAAA